MDRVVSSCECVQAVVNELDRGLVEVLNSKMGNSTVLAVPVKHPEGGVIIIVCLIFPVEQSNISIDHCEAVVQECFR